MDNNADTQSSQQHPLLDVINLESINTIPSPKEQLPGEILDQGNPEPSKMSKSQLKKLRKRQEWEASRDERKMKRKKKKLAARERRKADPPQVKQLSVLKQKPTKAKEQRDIPMTFIIDCSFDSMMNDNEMTSLSSQIHRCYTSVRKASLKPRLAISSFGGRLQERFDVVLGSQYKKWKGVSIYDEGVKEVGNMALEWMHQIPKDMIDFIPSTAHSNVASENSAELSQSSLVYLSSDSTNILTSLSPNTSYVIGGLVDKNRYKGHCHKLATEAGITTARLPIGEYVKLSSRKVLTVNHVVEIMVGWLETGDWEKSFLDVIPQRKGVTKKDDGNTANEKPESVKNEETPAEANESS